MALRVVGGRGASEGGTQRRIAATVAVHKAGVHLAWRLSGDEVIDIVHRSAEAYLDTRVEGAETVVYRLAGALDSEARAAAYAALKAVAEADETMHPMESTLLRHVAAAWKLNVD